MGVRMEENITIEFVRNWIVKHRLTRKSYESVLTDTLTNNGHYYIDNPYLRDWIRKNTEMFRNILPYELNENQQIVLDWLKYPLNDIPNRFAENYFAYVTCLFLGQAPDKVLKAYQELSPEQQLEVLAAFAEWGKKEVAE